MQTLWAVAHNVEPAAAGRPIGGESSDNNMTARFDRVLDTIDVMLAILGPG